MDQNKRFEQIYQHFKGEPFKHSYSIFKICQVMAQNIDVSISKKGQFVCYNNQHTFSTFEFVLYLYHRKKKLNAPRTHFEEAGQALKIL